MTLERVLHDATHFLVREKIITARPWTESGLTIKVVRYHSDTTLIFRLGQERWVKVHTNEGVRVLGSNTITNETINGSLQPLLLFDALSEKQLAEHPPPGGGEKAQIDVKGGDRNLDKVAPLSIASLRTGVCRRDRWAPVRLLLRRRYRSRPGSYRRPPGGAGRACRGGIGS